MQAENENESIDRRGAIKKGLAAGAAAGLVWSAPKVEGLTLRPNYAAAASVNNPVTVSIAYTGGMAPGALPTAAFMCCDIAATATVTQQASGGTTPFWDLTKTPAPPTPLTRENFNTIPGGLMNTAVGPLVGADLAGNINAPGTSFNIEIEYSCSPALGAGAALFGIGNTTREQRANLSG